MPETKSGNGIPNFAPQTRYPAATFSVSNENFTFPSEIVNSKLFQNSYLGTVIRGETKIDKDNGIYVLNRKADSFGLAYFEIIGNKPLLCVAFEDLLPAYVELINEFESLCISNENLRFPEMLWCAEAWCDLSGWAPLSYDSTGFEWKTVQTVRSYVGAKNNKCVSSNHKYTLPIFSRALKVDNDLMWQSNFQSCFKSTPLDGMVLYHISNEAIHLRLPKSGRIVTHYFSDKCPGKSLEGNPSFSPFVISLGSTFCLAYLSPKFTMLVKVDKPKHKSPVMNKSASGEEEPSKRRRSSAEGTRTSIKKECAHSFRFQLPLNVSSMLIDLGTTNGWLCFHPIMSEIWYGGSTKLHQEFENGPSQLLKGTHLRQINFPTHVQPHEIHIYKWGGIFVFEKAVKVCDRLLIAIIAIKGRAKDTNKEEFRLYKVYRTTTATNKDIEYGVNFAVAGRESIDGELVIYVIVNGKLTATTISEEGYFSQKGHKRDSESSSSSNGDDGDNDDNDNEDNNNNEELENDDTQICQSESSDDPSYSPEDTNSDKSEKDYKNDDDDDISESNVIKCKEENIENENIEDNTEDCILFCCDDIGSLFGTFLAEKHICRGCPQQKALGFLTSPDVVTIFNVPSGQYLQNAFGSVQFPLTRNR